MLTATKPFLALTAADLMSPAVVVIPTSMSLQAAARLLSRFAISGAPVVDAEGRCVGVLSTTDFLARVQEGNPARTRHLRNLRLSGLALKYLGTRFPLLTMRISHWKKWKERP